MKEFLVLVGFCLLVPLNVRSQSDKEAFSILDRFSARARNAPSVSMKFDMITVNQAEGTTARVSGSAIINHDKYRLDLKDNIIWFNGEQSWNYLPNENEVTISRPDKKDDSFQSHPSALFSMYRKGYKTRLLEDNQDSYLIDLYPEDINSDHIRIRLSLTKPALDLKSLEYKYKNGITVTLDINSFDLKQKPDPSAFVFSPGKYSGVEIVDLR